MVFKTKRLAVSSNCLGQVLMDANKQPRAKPISEYANNKRGGESNLVGFHRRALLMIQVGRSQGEPDVTDVTLFPTLTCTCTKAPGFIILESGPILPSYNFLINGLKRLKLERAVRREAEFYQDYFTASRYGHQSASKSYSGQASCEFVWSYGRHSNPS